MIGIGALPGHLVQVVSAYLFDDAVPLKLTLPMMLTAAVSAFQVATGWAITRQRYAGIFFAGYVLACFALTIATALIARGDASFSASVALGAVVETFGLPVLIAIASLRYADRLEDTRSFSDISAALFVLALRTFISVPLTIMATIRMTHGASVSLGSWVGLFLEPVIFLALGVVALLGSRSRPAARIYIIVSVAVAVGLAILAIVWTTVDDGNEMVRKFVISSRLLGLVALVEPAVLWLFLIAPSVDRQGSRLPMWIAISYVPMFVGRVFVSGQVAAQFGHAPAAWVVTIAVAFALVLLALGDATLRDLRTARTWAIAAAVVASLLLIAGVVYLLRQHEDTFGQRPDLYLLAPLGYLIASTVGAAVYRRR